MDRAALEELFAFTDYSWRQYVEAVRPLGNETLVKAAPGSGWPALRDALAHINWAYVRWLADPAGTSAIEPEQITSWDELEAYRGRVRSRFREYLDSLSDSALAASREMNIDGEPMRYSPAEIFVHVLLHEREHHGDINTLLYQLGVEPTMVEYRFSLPDRRRRGRQALALGLPPTSPTQAHRLVVQQPSVDAVKPLRYNFDLPDRQSRVSALATAESRRNDGNRRGSTRRAPQGPPRAQARSRLCDAGRRDR